jgi:hypothetical protein
MHSELHGIVGPEAARAQRPRSTAIIVPSANRLRLDIFFAFWVSLVIQVIWGCPAPITNLIVEVRVNSCVDQELNTSPAAVVVSRQGAVWSAEFWSACKDSLRGGTLRACRGPGKTKALSGHRPG